MVSARKYRPQSFAEVLGQDPIVTTLKNAIKKQLLAHAYLFCGARGTGKTTLARVLAKALNCLNPQDNEPCNTCNYCREISSGSSLDVLEIDGASHRGIDDVRQITETASYAASSGKHKIYIIDEVHMLTKEAFNALLKTLEEPPPKVIFLFATTEPHKVPATILSRCQRFNLNRIPAEMIKIKLRQIAADHQVAIDEEALQILSQRADGALRDAESLLDQMMTFQEGKITAATVNSILGMMSKDCFFALDKAGKEGNLSMAFEVAEQVFSQGKDVSHFLDNLIEHFRNILLIKLAGKEASFLSIGSQDRARYEEIANFYNQEQCLYVIDFLMETQTKNRFNASNKFVLEAILLHVLRSHHRVPVDVLVKRLVELEKGSGEQNVEAKSPPKVTPKEPPKIVKSSVSEDPTPSKEDLGHSFPVEAGARMTVEAKAATAVQQRHYDTLMQFAAVELEGTIQTKK